MPTFLSTDGTPLAYHRDGAGKPLICLPGGPMQASEYLGDLGGLSAHHELVRLDLRGTGDSGTPADEATYRLDQLIDDVESFRAHLRIEQLDLLGHSAGASLALRYAERFPDRISRLLLINPSAAAVGLEITDADRREVAELRREESWFPEAFAAFERIWAGQPTPADWAGIAPFTRGIHQEQIPDEERFQNTDAAAVYYSDGALDPPTTRAALVGLQAPVLLVAGELDVSLPPKRAAEYVALFPHAQLAVQPGGGHYAWLDDPTWLTQTVTDFLA